MNATLTMTVLLVVLATLMTAALFMLYQNPLMEIYLANWAPC